MLVVQTSSQINDRAGYRLRREAALGPAIGDKQVARIADRESRLGVAAVQTTAAGLP